VYRRNLNLKAKMKVVHRVLVSSAHFQALSTWV
jgi:hypothetical protein